ncbi:MAG: MMPL family transporter [Acidimicrobiales bacterium]|nr:MMPL family transporter [Acidimicrobiales bacterium]
MSRALHRLGRFAVRRRGLVLVGWLIAAVLAWAGVGALGGGYSDDFRIPSVESQQALDVLTERFPEASGGTAQVVVHTEDASLTDPDNQQALGDLVDRLEDLPRVLTVLDPQAGGLVSEDGRTAIARVQYDGDTSELGTEAYEQLEEAVEPTRATGLQVELGGDLPQYAAHPETGAAELIGVAGAVIILLVAFGSIIAMGLPIGIAAVGLGFSTALILLAGLVFDIPAESGTLATMIGMGVGIDYALFIVTRYRSELRSGLTVADAAGRATATAGQAVVFAGGTVVIAILGLALAGIPAVTAMGFASALVVAVMVLASITLLPALLGFAGLRLLHASLPWTRRREATDDEWRERLTRLGASADLRPDRWQRWGDHVTTHPWPWLVAATLVLLVAAAPLLSMRLGQTDAGTNPPSTTTRKAYDLTAQAFGEGFNGPLLLSVELTGDAAADAAALDALGQGLAADPAVAVVAPPEVNDAGDAAIVTVVPTDAPQDEATTELVHRLRDDVVPAALDGTGSEAYIGGLTAVFIDLSDKVASRLPVFIAAVVGLSFLLLMAVFRSVLVPLKAALMNLLSIGAAYGVVVAVFQWGWGRSLIGLDETVPIVSFVPMFMFAVLFGLSMDYEVFLLSRIREEHLDGRGNRRAVINGISSTARVITSAALIMILVFSGFVLGPQPIIKMFGVGLATAVLVDATIVRVILVPATMRLMGEANWWLPRWLDRLLPHLDIEGTGGLPAPEMRPDAEARRAERVPVAAA